MNTKAIMNAKAAVVLFSLILAACGGGSSDGSSENAPAEVAPHVTHSTNISGVWSGTFIAPVGAVTATVNQPESDSAENPVQTLTAVLTIDLGGPVFMSVTGTKSGDTWSASGTDGTSIVSIEQTLSSDDNSSGTISIQSPAIAGAVLVLDYDLTKS